MNNNTYKISVPATSANLGAGIDTMGLAFNLYNTFIIKEIDSDDLIIEGVSSEYNNKNNLIYQSCLKLFHLVDYPIKGLKIREENKIPFEKGLGSSASCIIGGLIGANAIAGNPLSKEKILTLGSKMEGHPDNIAPALFGNLTASMLSTNKTFTIVKRINPKFRFFACIPQFNLLTKKSRSLLPEKFPINDIIFNISHSLLTFNALESGDKELLKFSLKDKIHQSYRFNHISESKKIISFVQSHKYVGSYLSGAGPTIIVISVDKTNKSFIKLRNFIESYCKNWKIKELKPDTEGCKIQII